MRNEGPLLIIPLEKISDEDKAAVSRKISVFRGEGLPQKQAIAAAFTYVKKKRLKKDKKKK